MTFHALDLKFHAILVEGLDLPRVAAVIDASRANIDRVRRLLSSRRRHADTLAEHRTIFRALEGHDPAAAGDAMKAHLKAVMDELELLSATSSDLFVT